MDSQAEIERSIRSKLPLVFGQPDYTDEDAFPAELNLLADHAKILSEPFLRPETTRYQSILLYVSLIYISISLFNVGNITFENNILSVDDKFLAVYVIFIATVALIFLVKAYFDYKWSSFSQYKNINVPNAAIRVVDIALQKLYVQQHYWDEVIDIIRAAQKSWADATARAGNKATIVPRKRVRLLSFDLAGLRKEPELAVIIDTNEKYLEELSTALNKDIADFEEKVERILSAREDDYDDTIDDSYEIIGKAYDEILSRWTNAKNKLVDEYVLKCIELQKNNPYLERAGAILVMFGRIKIARRIYVCLEIIAPVLFATVAIWYVT